jgi:hypothetical protein
VQRNLESATEGARQDQLYGGFSLRRKNDNVLLPTARSWAASTNGDLTGIADVLATENKLLALEAAIEEHESATLKLALENGADDVPLFTDAERDEAALADAERQRSTLEAKLMELVKDLQRRAVGSLRDAHRAPSESQTHAWDLLQQALALRNRLGVDAQQLVESEDHAARNILLDGGTGPRRDRDERAALVADEEERADGLRVRATAAIANLGGVLPNLIHEIVSDGGGAAVVDDHGVQGDVDVTRKHGREEVRVPGRERRRP